MRTLGACIGERRERRDAVQSACNAIRETHTKVTLPIAPTVQREFKRDDVVTAFARVYEGGQSAPASVVVRTKIEDERGNTAFVVDRQYNASRFAASREADCRVELPLGRLAAGRYLLTIEAKMGKRTAVRTALFTIVGT